jgi:hypothetical protein
MTLPFYRAGVVCFANDSYESTYWTMIDTNIDNRVRSLCTAMYIIL